MRSMGWWFLASCAGSGGVAEDKDDSEETPTDDNGDDDDDDDDDDDNGDDDDDDDDSTIPSGPFLDAFDIQTIAYDPGGYEHDFMVLSLTDTDDLLACALAVELDLEPEPGTSQLAVFATPSFLWSGCPEGLTVLDCEDDRPCGWFRRWDEEGLEVEVLAVQGLIEGTLDPYGGTCDMRVELRLANDEEFELDLSIDTSDGSPPWCLQ